MAPLNSDENPYRPPDGLLAVDPVEAAPHGIASTCKRAVKVVACLLSATWVAVLYIIPAVGAFAPTRDAKITCAAITAAAMVPILLFLRGRWMYFLGLPTLLLAALAIYDLLTTLDRTSPWMRLP